MTDLKFDSIPLLKSLSEIERESLVSVLRFEKKGAGELLFMQDEPGDRMYIINDGQLEVFMGHGTPDSRRMAELGPGDFVGEMSLVIRDGRRTATVVAKTEVEMFVILQNDFDRLLKQRPGMAYAMVQELGERLAESNDSTISDLKIKNRELERAYDELKAAQAEIVEKEKMEHELGMAREIQMNILPKELSAPEGCDFGAKMQPARAVGGDFFDFVDLGGGKFGIAIGDVSDKGVPAALFMAQICTLLRVEAHHHPNEPASVLNAINAQMLKMNDAGLFVTMVYGVFDCESGDFHYARAGHEVPVLFDPKGKVSALPYGQGTPLCIFEDSPVDVQTVTIPAGHTLMLYTDGGVDAESSEHGFFGLEKLEETFRVHISDPAQELVDRVLDVLLSFQGEGQFDDATLVAIRKN